MAPPVCVLACAWSMALYAALKRIALVVRNIICRVRVFVVGGARFSAVLGSIGSPRRRRCVPMMWTHSHSRRCTTVLWVLALSIFAQVLQSESCTTIHILLHGVIKQFSACDPNAIRTYLATRSYNHILRKNVMASYCISLHVCFKLLNNTLYVAGIVIVPINTAELLVSKACNRAGHRCADKQFQHKFSRCFQLTSLILYCKECEKPDESVALHLLSGFYFLFGNKAR